MRLPQLLTPNDLLSLQSTIDWSRLAPTEATALRRSIETLHRPFLTLRKYYDGPIWPKQWSFLKRLERQVLYGGAAGGGKALSIDTPVPTTNGFKRIDEVHAGDFVFGSDGNPHLVMAESEIMVLDGWKIQFDDGSEIICNDEHEWITLTNADMGALTRLEDNWRAKRREKRESRVSGKKSQKFTQVITARNKTRKYEYKSPPTGSVKTTQEITETLLSGRRRNHFIRNAKPLCVAKRDLPIDPYLLGIWLGDGTSTSGSITTADREVIEAFFGAGYEVSKQSAKYGWTVHGLVTQLRAMGVLENKRIPSSYLFSSEQQRLSLLQGLMDSDGTVAKNSGSAEFTNTNHALAEGVHALVSSLGWKARMREGRAKLRGKDCGPKWTIKWVPTQYVFRLSRKRELQNLATRRVVKFRSVVSAERVYSVPMKCLRVSSPDSTFLAGRSMIPTHNSWALFMGALMYVDQPLYRAVIYRRVSKSLDDLIDFSHQWLAKKAKWNQNEKTWTFTSGAKIKLSYMQYYLDTLKQKGPGYQYIAFDEATEFLMEQIIYMSSRLRKPFCRLHRLHFNPNCYQCKRVAGMNIVPDRKRLASNPDGPQRVKIRDYYVSEQAKEDFERGRMRPIYFKLHGNEYVVFIPATVDDNFGMDSEKYKEEALGDLDPVTQRRLRDGDWWLSQNSIFSESNLRYYVMRGQIIQPLDADNKNLGPGIDQRELQRFFTVDTAGTEKQKDLEARDPTRASWSVCSCWNYWPQHRYLFARNVWRDKVNYPVLKRAIKLQYERWRPSEIHIENAHFGPALHADLLEDGLPVRLISTHTKADKGQSGVPGKVERSKDLQSTVADHRFFLPLNNDTWVPDFVAELIAWTGLKSEQADQIDTGSYASKIVKLEPAVEVMDREHWRSR